MATPYIFYDPKRQRLMEYTGKATRIYWSADMLSFLHKHYATTSNEELAGMLGVGVRTLTTKAAQLGLTKDPQWIADVREIHRLMAQAESKRKGYPGCFQKGVHSNPAGEFQKGHNPSAEHRRKQSERLKQWFRLHPDAMHERLLKAWETRRNKTKQ